MAVLGKNTCTPERIYGPLPQTIFLGCSVKSFTVSAGWGEQSSTLTVELVQDPCIGPKIWWDKSLNRQTGDIADPGFLAPDPGVAVYFRMEEDPNDPSDRGGFEYCGLIQSWIEKTDPNGNPSYSVQVTDPRVVIENTQLILDSYPGPTSGVFNLINVYAYVENLGSACSSSPAGAIGGVTQDNAIGNIANDRGINWNDVKCSVHTLTASTNKAFTKSQYNAISRDARIVYVGPTPSQEGYGVIKADSQITDPIFQTIPNANLYNHDYLIDLSEFDQVIAPTYYRIGGDSTISLSEVLTQVSADASCDYYLELLPVKIAGNVVKIIKVRLVSRAGQPVLGRLDDFIAARQSAAENANGGVLSYTRGQEVRNESTSTYLMGGNIREPFSADNTQMLPFFGVDTDGALIQATINGNNEYLVRLDVRRLNTTLFTPFTSDWCIVSESELMAVLGDMDSWKSVSHAKGGDTYTWMNTNLVPQSIDSQILADSYEGKKPPVATVIPQNTSISDETDFSKNTPKDVDKIYSFLKSFADEFYGKQFLVNAPFVCVTRDLETQRYRFSHDPSTDGCWVSDSTVNIIGLQHNGPASDFFRDDTGKYQTIVKFPVTGGFTMGGAGGSIVADPTKLGDENYISDGVSIWVKAELDARWVAGTPLDPSASTISFVVKTSTAVPSRQDEVMGLDEPHGGMGNFLNAAGTAIPGSADIAGDRGSFSMSELHVAVAPTAALCPTLNNTEVYGPWGVAGLPGQVTAQKDEGLVPWEYGSNTLLYRVALDQVANSVAQMRKSERGTVSVAGFPNIPIGAELFSVDTTTPPTSQGNQKYLETRSVSINSCDPNISYYYCPMNAWTGEFGPNITNVNVNVGPGGFTTEYQFSTFTSRFGAFAKQNAARLKEIGQRRLQANRNIRAKFLQGLKVQDARNRSRQIVEAQLAKSARAPKSAHHMFIGRYTSEYRNEVSSITAKDAGIGYTTNSSWSNSAMMSLDGLLRPVSRAGDGGFTPYITKLGGCNSGTPQASDPPINERRELLISTEYLDPVSNATDSLPTDRDSAGTPAGHDIEALGRNTQTPAKAFTIAENEAVANGQGYMSDYRFFALKGPLMIQQFGYDLNNKPVPNEADSAASAEGGSFTTSSLTDKFLSNFMANPKTWPVAPLDLRLDRERGVWTTPPPPRPLHATNDGCILDDGTSDVNNIKPNTVDENGGAIGSPTIDVEWPWTPSPPSGIGKFPSYYDNIDCAHYAFPIYRLDVQQQDEYEANNTDLIQDINRLVFGSGFEVTSQLGTCVNSVFINFTGIPTGGGGGSGGIYVQGDDCSVNGGALSFPKTVVSAGNSDGDPEIIQFGDGLQMQDLGDTVGVTAYNYISGYIQQTGDNGCPTRQELHTFETLVASGGLVIKQTGASDDPCTATIIGYPAKISGYNEDDWCNNDPTHVYDTRCYSTWSFGRGIVTSEQFSDTEKILQIESQLKVRGSGSCDPENTKVSFLAPELVFGTGFTVSEYAEGTPIPETCAIHINSNIKISGVSSVIGALPTKEVFESVKFLGNLDVEVNQDDCLITVSGYDSPWSGDSSCGSQSTGLLYPSQIIVSTGLKLTSPAGGQRNYLGYEVNAPITLSSDMKIRGYSGCGTDGRQTIGEYRTFETISFEDGIIVETGVKGCGFTIKAPSNVSGKATCGSSNLETSFFSRLIFGTGLEVTSYGDTKYDCSFIVDSTLKIEKNGDCVSTDDGNAAISETALNKLTISSGLRLIDDGDCNFRLAGGFKNLENTCALDPLPWQGGGGEKAAEGFYSQLTVGSGLVATSPDNCTLEISSRVNIVGAATNKYGNPLKDPNGIPIPGYAQTCTNIVGVSGEGADGPWPNRLTPKSMNTLIAAKGIGVSSCNEACGDSAAILFSSQVDLGSSHGTPATCSSFTNAQVWARKFSDDFAISEAGGLGSPYQGGGAVQDSDGSLVTLIELNTGIAHTVSFVTGITVTKSAGNVTDVSYECCTLTLRDSCGGKFWITDIGNCGNCQGGGAEEVGGGPQP